MNKERRKALAEAIHYLNAAQEKIENAKDIISDVYSEEDEAYDNLPESVQDSDRGEAMAENVDTLDTAHSELEDIFDQIQDQIDSLQEVIDK